MMKLNCSFVKRSGFSSSVNARQHPMVAEAASSTCSYMPLIVFVQSGALMVAGGHDAFCGEDLVVV